MFPAVPSRGAREYAPALGHRFGFWRDARVAEAGSTTGPRTALCSGPARGVSARRARPPSMEDRTDPGLPSVARRRRPSKGRLAPGQRGRRRAMSCLAPGHRAANQMAVSGGNRWGGRSTLYGGGPGLAFGTPEGGCRSSRRGRPGGRRAVGLGERAGEEFSTDRASGRADRTARAEAGADERPRHRPPIRQGAFLVDLRPRHGATRSVAKLKTRCGASADNCRNGHLILRFGVCRTATPGRLLNVWSHFLLLKRLFLNDYSYGDAVDCRLAAKATIRGESGRIASANGRAHGGAVRDAWQGPTGTTGYAQVISARIHSAAAPATAFLAVVGPHLRRPARRIARQAGYVASSILLQDCRSGGAPRLRPPCLSSLPCGLGDKGDSTACLSK